jgi:hypothetical protein
MIVRSALLSLVLLLAPCAAIAAPAASSPDLGLGEPQPFVASFYAPAPEIQGDVDEDAPVPEEPPVYGESLRALMEIDARRDMNYLDFDWVSGGQDLPDYRNLKISEVNRTETTARYRVTFQNYREARERIIDLVREDGRWLIEDVYLVKPEGRWLSRILVENRQD